MMAAKEEVMTTLFTVGALALIALRMPVVPLMAGSRRSFFVSWMLKWKGLAVWMTTSKGGLDTTAPSKAMRSGVSSMLNRCKGLGVAYRHLAQCPEQWQSRACRFHTWSAPA